MNPKQEDSVTKEEFRATNQKIFQRLNKSATNQYLEVVKKEVNSDTNDLYILNEAICTGKEYVAYNTETRDEMISKIGETMLQRDQFNDAMKRILEGQDKLIEMFDTTLQEMKARNSSISNLKKKRDRNDVQDQTLARHNKRITELEVAL
ncbi:hypothetical protein L0Z72_14880 [candidate division KSB1 bacterium]|nr:hypothetical protein [candidate division KSB1 bacterium]